MAGERRVTSEFSTIPFRVEQVEDHVREQRKLNASLNEGLFALRTALEHGLENLADRIAEHDKNRDRWRAFAMSILSAIALALIGIAVKQFTLTRVP